MTTENSDSLDYRVMMAREVASEHAWRIEGRTMGPADFAEVDRIAHETATDTTIRHQVEEWCGEPLA